MKYRIEQSVKFKRDLKLATKRGYDISQLTAKEGWHDATLRGC
jgi:mRNA-degrading endonuclease YafQ of YafQ-DinJ toxin-antitoxin module